MSSGLASSKCGCGFGRATNRNQWRVAFADLIIVADGIAVSGPALFAHLAGFVYCPLLLGRLVSVMECPAL